MFHSSSPVNDYPMNLSSINLPDTGEILAQDDVSSWQPTLDLDLRASMVGIQLAARSMIKAKRPGSIIAVASAAGVYPHRTAPVYCAAKAGLIHFAKSVSAGLRKSNIHIGTICPQFVDTALVAQSSEEFKKDIAVRFGNLMTPETIVEEIMKLAQDPKRSGAAAVILQNGMRFDWDPPPTAQKKPKAAAGAVSVGMHAPRQQWFAPGPIQKTYTAWQVTKLTHKFPEAVELKTLDTPQVCPPRCAPPDMCYVVVTVFSFGPNRHVLGHVFWGQRSQDCIEHWRRCRWCRQTACWSRGW